MIKEYLIKIKETEKYRKVYFPAIVFTAYIILYFFEKELVLNSLDFSFGIIKKIIPVFIFVFIVMVVTNYFINPKLIEKYLAKSSGIKRWVIAILGGIISTGPIYMWYPILKDLKKRGVSFGFIAVFLYNKAVKPFLIPVMIYYFGLKYTIILTLVMIALSIIQGLIIELLEDRSYI